MAKPINPNGPHIPVTTPSATGAGKAAAASAAFTESAKGASEGAKKGSAAVNISEGGRGRADAMAKALDIAKNTPDIREDRVADIKARIAAGTYQVDSGQIADGMLREAIKDHLATER